MIQLLPSEFISILAFTTLSIPSLLLSFNSVPASDYYRLSLQSASTSPASHKSPQDSQMISLITQNPSKPASVTLHIIWRNLPNDEKVAHYYYSQNTLPSLPNSIKIISLRLYTNRKDNPRTQSIETTISLVCIFISELAPQSNAQAMGQYHLYRINIYPHTKDDDTDADYLKKEIFYQDISSYFRTSPETHNKLEVISLDTLCSLPPLPLPLPASQSKLRELIFSTNMIISDLMCSGGRGISSVLLSKKHSDGQSGKGEVHLVPCDNVMIFDLEEDEDEDESGEADEENGNAPENEVDEKSENETIDEESMVI
jgi:hypothetical protein